MAVMLQNLFPAINVTEVSRTICGSQRKRSQFLYLQVKLTSCRRVVMFHMDKATGEVCNSTNPLELNCESAQVEFRHYFIRAKGVGHSKQVKRVCILKSWLQPIAEWSAAGAQEKESGL